MIYMMKDVSCIILTFNEERHIARCIENVKRIATKIFVVDSFSTDRTCEIAKEHGAEVFQNKYVNQSQQFIWAMEHCPIKTEWTMRMDADEYLTDELLDEIKRKLPLLPISVTGCELPLMVKFLGRNLRHGKIKKIHIMRIWRTGKAKMEQRWMDERCYVIEGATVAMNHYFVDENLNGIHTWIQKHNNYANREIVAAYEYFWKDSSDRISELKQRNKEKGLYYKIPKYLRAFIYFFIRYIFCGGFLDGKQGLIWAVLQAFWYRFLVDAKIEEMEFYLGKNPTPQEMKIYFKERFNIDVDK